MLAHAALLFFALLPPQAGTADPEWNAALAQKQQSKFSEGAAAFEAFAKAHADDPRAAQARARRALAALGAARAGGLPGRRGGRLLPGQLVRQVRQGEGVREGPQAALRVARRALRRRGAALAAARRQDAPHVRELHRL